MTTGRLTFVALNVSDLQASVRFYREMLGIPLKDASHDAELEDPWYGGDHAAFSWTDGAFIVADFDAVYARVAGEGTRVVEPPREEPWGTTARFLDPDGNIVSITRV